MQYRITLVAGMAKRQEFRGSTLVLLETGAASELDVNVEVGGQTVEELRGVRRGLRLRGPGFTGATFLSAVDAVLEVVVSQADISVNYTDGSTVNANIVGGPLAVVPDRGAPGAPVHVVGLTYSDSPATSIVDRAAVAAGPATVALLAADVARKAARFCNLGPDEVTIGTTGHTWAKRVIVLGVGDIWVEEKGANLAWVGVTDAAKAASVTVQEVRS